MKKRAAFVTSSVFRTFQFTELINVVAEQLLPSSNYKFHQISIVFYWFSSVHDSSNFLQQPNFILF